MAYEYVKRIALAMLAASVLALLVVCMRSALEPARSWIAAGFILGALFEAAIGAAIRGGKKP